MDPHSPATSPATYHEAILADWERLGIWDYLRYDAEGHLWINDLRVVDAARRYGTPLEIVDTTIIERRAREWMALAQGAADAIGYPGRLRYLYAAKANMASEVTHAAYRAGWSAETSAPQDLVHLRWLRAQGLIPADLRVVCNGFKLPASCHGWPDPRPPAARGPIVLPPLDHAGAPTAPRNPPYAQLVVEMAGEGWAITPVLDAGEIETFLAPGTPRLDVGLRLKFGKVKDLAGLDGLVSRFGMDRHALAAAADRVAAAEHLRFTMLHAMVGAAETIPVDDYVAGLSLAGRIWADLRRRHPTLAELNIGGGMPPLGEAYDHGRVVRGMLEAFREAGAAAGVPPPDVTFELGNLVAAEAGFHLFKVMQLKANHGGADTLPWAIVDGGLMAAIPDMLLVDKPFRILAASGAHRPPFRACLGDVTCDSDGRYPPKSFGPGEAVWLPAPEGGVPGGIGAGGLGTGDGLTAGGIGASAVTTEDAVNVDDEYVVIQGVGAYQEILAGVRGAHHCGLLEAVELILERGDDGVVHARLMPRQIPEEASRLLGYTDRAARALRGLRASRDGASSR